MELGLLFKVLLFYTHAMKLRVFLGFCIALGWSASSVAQWEMRDLDIDLEPNGDKKTPYLIQGKTALTPSDLKVQVKLIAERESPVVQDGIILEKIPVQGTGVFLNDRYGLITYGAQGSEVRGAIEVIEFRNNQIRSLALKLESQAEYFDGFISGKMVVVTGNARTAKDEPARATCRGYELRSGRLVERFSVDLDPFTGVRIVPMDRGRSFVVVSGDQGAFEHRDTRTGKIISDSTLIPQGKLSRIGDTSFQDGLDIRWSPLLGSPVFLTGNSSSRQFIYLKTDSAQDEQKKIIPHTLAQWPGRGDAPQRFLIIPPQDSSEGLVLERFFTNAMSGQLRSYELRLKNVLGSEAVSQSFTLKGSANLPGVGNGLASLGPFLLLAQGDAGLHVADVESLSVLGRFPFLEGESSNQVTSGIWDKKPVVLASAGVGGMKLYALQADMELNIGSGRTLNSRSALWVRVPETLTVRFSLSPEGESPREISLQYNANKSKSKFSCVYKKQSENLASIDALPSAQDGYELVSCKGLGLKRSFRWRTLEIVVGSPGATVDNATVRFPIDIEKMPRY